MPTTRPTAMPPMPRLSRRAVLAAPLIVMACKARAATIRLAGPAFGTTYHATVIVPRGGPDKATLQAAVDGALAQVDASMSNWSPTSEIARINASRSAGPHPLSAPLRQVIEAAQAINAASDGALDVTIGPLIELWGFGAAGSRDRVPDEAAIARARAASGQARSFRLTPQGLEKLNPEAEIYLSAIAKGYGVDHVARAIAALGPTDYMVEIGGEIVAAGRNPDGQRWRVGIETPDAAGQAITQIVQISGLGLATSGDYRNYFQDQGHRYSHLIDPATGRPVTHRTTSATVLADNAMLADGWATAMLVLGRARGMAVAQAHDLAVLFIERSEGGDAPFTLTTTARFDALQQE